MTYQFPPFFWLDFLYFFVCTFFAFYIPGAVVLSSQKISRLTRIVVSFGIGMVLWGLQGLVFGYLHIRYVSYVYLLLAALIWVKQQFPFHPPNIHFQFGKKYSLTLVIILLGVCVQLATVWFNGLHMQKGDYYCCGADIDNINHIAITQAVVNNIPPHEPGLSLLVIKNYHYLGSVVVGELVRVFGLPLITTDFQYMTVFLSILLALLVVVFVETLGLDSEYANWLLFFLYFGGDFVFGLLFLTRHQISFSMSSLEDGSKFLANYPRAFAMNGFFLGLIFLLLWIKNYNKKLGLLTALVLGVLISLKVYIGIFALSGFFVCSIYIFIKKKDFFILAYFLLSLLLALALYLPVNSGAGGLYFTGFWLFENYITQPGFGLLRWELARLIYQSHHNYLKVTLFEVSYMGIYFISLFGTKLLGLFQSKKSLLLFPTELHMFLVPGLAGSLILGSFFQQSISGANTFNFLVSVFIIGSLYAGLACYFWTRKLSSVVRFSIIIAIILITIPRVVFETGRNISLISSTRGYFVPNNQLDVFQFIHKHSVDGPLLIDQRLDFEFDKQTPYVFIYTNKPMYLSGQVADLDTHAVSYAQRTFIANELIRGNNLCSNAQLLDASGIKYVLTASSDFFTSSQSAVFMDTLYRKDTILFLGVNQQRLKKFLDDIKLGKIKDCFVSY